MASSISGGNSSGTKRKADELPAEETAKTSKYSRIESPMDTSDDMPPVGSAGTYMNVESAFSNTSPQICQPPVQMQQEATLQISGLTMTSKEWDEAAKAEYDNLKHIFDTIISEIPQAERDSENEAILKKAFDYMLSKSAYFLENIGDFYFKGKKMPDQRAKEILRLCRGSYSRDNKINRQTAEKLLVFHARIVDTAEKWRDNFEINPRRFIDDANIIIFASGYYS